MSTTSPPETAGQRLRAARGDRTYREMASILNVALGTYQGWEGGAEPSISKALEVEARLGLRIWTHGSPLPVSAGAEEG